VLHQVGDLFELNVKLRCQRVKQTEHNDFHWWFLKFLVLKQSYFYNFFILPPRQECSAKHLTASLLDQVLVLYSTICVSCVHALWHLTGLGILPRLLFNCFKSLGTCSQPNQCEPGRAHCCCSWVCVNNFITCF